jgi:ABC-type nitrate/sulfonate/bicarbonate transport system substrate-binding protein
MFMGMDLGTGLSVVARPGINTVEDLRGKVLSVDAPDSGFAYVLYKILRAHGLERGRDYQIVQTSGVFARFQGLLAGNFDATLLSSGFELRATNAGYKLLESVTAIANPYLSGVSAARQSWMEQNRDVVVCFTRVLSSRGSAGLGPRWGEQGRQVRLRSPNSCMVRILALAPPTRLHDGASTEGRESDSNHNL